MKLCVGATSRRVVEEAAKLKVHQIVASRRQVMNPVGYSGYSPASLVESVNRLSNGQTQVVRDHGGPLQGGFFDDGVQAFNDDVNAGFDGLHIDVCNLPRGEQCDRLVKLCRSFPMVDVEVGGEHEKAAWNTELLSAVITAGIRPSYVVVGVGTYVWADRQIGHLSDGAAVRTALKYAHKEDIKTKVHNCDFTDWRGYAGLFDAFNIAPEFGNDEVDAWLHTLTFDDGQRVLTYAYDTGAWSRWFRWNEGTYLQRARAALRYHLTTRYVEKILNQYDDAYVREVIRNALVERTAAGS